MLILFETAAGYALFKLKDESLLQNVDNIWKELSSGNESLEIVSFKRYKSIAEAVTNATNISEGKLSKTLKKMLKKSVTEEGEKLAVADTNSLEIKCLHNTAISELMRSIRANIDTLIGDESITHEIAAMRLGVSHAVGRYKVKFNPEKIDTMIVQAVSLLDDLDKELNNYVMRCREWYGWHFPELGKLITDPQAYAKCIKSIGMRQNAQTAKLEAVLPTELVDQVRAEAEISMGTDISELDLTNIWELCDQIIEFGQYRAQLHEYLKNRMSALAPNLTVLLGELVGARLVSKAGSLMALAKCPASTVQILGAEKALFRALKTKKDTPKYGLIYHAQLITQSGQKAKGKIARKLAAKVALATRIDALCDESLGNQQGIDARAYLETVIKTENARSGVKKQRYSGAQHAPKDAYTFKKEIHRYDPKVDITLKSQKPTEEQTETPVEKKKKKKRASESVAEEMEEGEKEMRNGEEEKVKQQKEEKFKKLKEEKVKQQEEKQVKQEAEEKAEETATKMSKAQKRKEAKARKAENAKKAKKEPVGEERDDEEDEE
uniref:Nop domain-containing protein n=1 Tax=Meloidogyne hapla TaxID=6305 RepID=A0A1I8AZT6_MELHA